MEKRGGKRDKRSRSKSNKKGAGHIEMIVSFSIFFLFVLFLFTYMNPVKQPSISKVLLEVVEQGLDNYTARILEIAVKVTSGGCFQIKCPFNLSRIPLGEEKEHIFVKDESGRELGFNVEGQNLVITGTGFFFYIYHSDKNIKPSPSGCQGQITPTPTFSVPKLQILYLDSELVRLNGDYRDNYEELKTQFGFPSASDFAIRIYDGDGTPLFTMSVTKPKGVDVKARDTPIVILRHDTKEKIKGSMNIQVW